MFRRFYLMIEPGNYPFAWVSIALGVGFIVVVGIFGWHYGIYADEVMVASIGIIPIGCGLLEFTKVARKSKQGREL